MQLEPGIRVHLRDVDTLDDFGVATAPTPVEPGDLVCDTEHVYRVEAVLLPMPLGAPVVPVLARRVELAIAAR